MDTMAIAGMIFTLLTILMIGGFVLLFPLTRRLGAFLEQRLQEKQTKGVDPRELAELRKVVRSLQAEVARISEQQAFTESLLRTREPQLLPTDTTPPSRKSSEPEHLPEQVGPTRQS